MEAKPFTVVPMARLRDWMLHTRLRDWVLQPRLRDWVLHPRLRDWVLHPRLRDWVLHPRLRNWMLHPRLRDWMLHPVPHFLHLKLGLQTLLLEPMEGLRLALGLLGASDSTTVSRVRVSLESG